SGALASPAPAAAASGERSVFLDDSIGTDEAFVQNGFQEGTDDKVAFDEEGVLTIVERADERHLVHPQGTKLLRRLVDSQQTVMRTRRKDEGGHHVIAVEDKVNKGLPADSIVELDLSGGQEWSVLVGSGEKNGNRLERKMPFTVALYH